MKKDNENTDNINIINNLIVDELKKKYKKIDEFKENLLDYYLKNNIILYDYYNIKRTL
jgi:hypothetical protein